MTSNYCTILKLLKEDYDKRMELNKGDKYAERKETDRYMDVKIDVIKYYL